MGDDTDGCMCRVFHLRFNEKEMVQEIYFLRQLSHDEAARKVGLPSVRTYTGGTSQMLL